MPDLLPEPFVGIILSVIVYAVGSGLIEVLCSPIVEACPFDNQRGNDESASLFLLLGSSGYDCDLHTVFCSVWHGQLEMAGCLMGTCSGHKYLIILQLARLSIL